MSLLDEVAGLLTGRPRDRCGGDRSRSPGGAHGVSRATADLDLLAVDPAVLDEKIWSDLRAAGDEVEVRRGDAEDPLAGVVRVAREGDTSVDVIVGKAAWQRDLLRRASSTRVTDTELPVAAAPDLALLKRYAGGPQDAWDIDQLLNVDPAIAAQVEAGLGSLPVDCADLWRSILERRRRSSSADLQKRRISQRYRSERFPDLSRHLGVDQGAPGTPRPGDRREERHLVEQVLRHHLQALQELRADVIVHPKLAVSRKSGAALLKEIEKAKPTEALRDLLRDGD